MRFTFLGTGTSSGVPAIGCDCAVCTSADPRDRRLRTSATVSWTDPKGQERCVLIDAGPDLREQALRQRMRRVDAVLFTHNHVDHTFGLDETRRFNVVQGSPIDVYAEPHTMEHLRRVYTHIFERQNNVNDSFVANLIPHVLSVDTPIDYHGVRFTPIRLLHGRLPVVGFRVEEVGVGEGGRAGSPPARAGGSAEPDDSPFPLAYCTDVSAIPPESYRKLTGLRTLVLDALRHHKHPTHFTLEEAVRVADQVGAQKTYFVHMSHDLQHEETEASLPEHMHLAWDGLVLAARAQMPDE